MDFYPAKGRFGPGERVVLQLACEKAEATHANITVWHLQRETRRLGVALTAPVTEIWLDGVQSELCGLGVQAEVYAGDALLDTLHTAVDIAKDGRVVRYGFLSDFAPEDEGADDVQDMAKYHINHVQFYDWSYRHHQLVASQEEYTDMMGKRNSLPVIRQKVDACRRHGMKAIAYGAVYAADAAFWQEHPTWGLYARSDVPLVFIDIFYFMNIRRQSPWRSHLYEQYRQAIQEVGFEGIHMDTYGHPKTALDADLRPIYLQEEFPSLINEAREALQRDGTAPSLIFNNVGAWPVRDTMHCHQSAVYMEIWPPYDRYRHLKELITAAKESRKPVVLAAYLAPFRLDTPERALECALLSSFAIAMHGATQLCLGEKGAMLTQGYYVDYTPLLPWQAAAIRSYQDFFVRYEELLFDDRLQDVSMTHCQGDNQEYHCNVPFSVDGQAERLWLCIRESRDTKLVALLNLCGNDDCWNQGKQRPVPVEGIILSVQVMNPAVRAYFAAPDAHHGQAQLLDCDCVPTERGYRMQIPLPGVQRGALVWLKGNGI